MRKLLTAAGAAIALSGCASMTFAPGPGMDASQFEPDSARCRIFARNDVPGYVVTGSQQFVDNYAAGAAIGTAFRVRANYRDCMEAKGWILETSANSGSAAAQTAVPSPGANADWQLRKYCKGERDAHVSQIDTECVGVPDPAK
jgi:Prokaryotic membrane lipoprotein lipid attachment site